MHGKEGRRLMLATATELKAEHVTLEEFRLYAKKVYGDDYDAVRTNSEWKYIDEKKRWKCGTIRENFPEVLELCKTCTKKSTDNDHIDIETAKKAIEIMTKGDPIRYGHMEQVSFRGQAVWLCPVVQFCMQQYIGE